LKKAEPAARVSREPGTDYPYETPNIPHIDSAKTDKTPPEVMLLTIYLYGDFIDEWSGKQGDDLS
jgi:hypothetical protein